MAGVVNRCRWCKGDCYDMEPCKCPESLKWGQHHRVRESTVAEKLTCPNCECVNVFVPARTVKCGKCNIMIYVNTTTGE